jgi:hypothetical protein
MSFPVTSGVVAPPAHVQQVRNLVPATTGPVLAVVEFGGLADTTDFAEPE